MFVALDPQNQSRCAWEVERSDGPFRCPNPACGAAVVLKKGVVRTHHFAHLPPACALGGGGEGEVHMFAKRSIYDALKAHPDALNCALERYLGEVRPDISLRIRGVPVAVEIQKSTISIDLIKHRMAAYTAKGIHVVWVAPALPKMTTHQNIEAAEAADDEDIEDDEVYRPRLWERYLHMLALGRLYFWHRGASVVAQHMTDYMLSRPGSSWSDQAGVHYSLGYEFRSKSLVRMLDFPTALHLADDFGIAKRDGFLFEGAASQPSRIWQDTMGKWW